MSARGRALAETLATDEHNNATEGGAFVFLDSDDNIVVSEDPNHLVSSSASAT